MSEKIDEQVKNFLDNIVYLRKLHKLSKKQMASALKIGLYSLNMIEQGKLPKRLNADIVIRIEEQFGISPQAQFKRLDRNSK